MNNMESNLTHPAEQEKVQKISLNEMVDLLKKKVREGITFLFQPQNIEKEDKEIKEFEEKIQKSAEISKAAGEYYKFLIPKSLKKPDKEYQPVDKEPEPDLQDIFLQAIKELKSKLPKKQFKKIKQKIINQNDNRELIGKLNEVKKKIEDQEIFIQTCAYRFQQENSPNIIEEKIGNCMPLNRENSWAVSTNLELVDPNNGIRLNLKELLPDGIEFCPSDLRKRNYELDEKKAKIKTIFMPVNLESYQGTKNSQGIFLLETLAKVRKGQIFYGDLTKKGGILSLLHEVSHAWQKAYYEDSGICNFEDFYNNVTYKLAVLSSFKQDVAKGEYPKDDFEERIIPLILEKLKDYGVEIDTDNFEDITRELKGEEIKIKRISTKQEFIIKNKKLTKLLEEYEREERDAWAHAIKTLRFLRKQGIDIEPQLKTLDDFKQTINQSLESYQEVVSQLVTSPEREVRFIKQKPPTKYNNAHPTP